MRFVRCSRGWLSCSAFCDHFETCTEGLSGACCPCLLDSHEIIVCFLCESSAGGYYDQQDMDMSLDALDDYVDPVDMSLALRLVVLVLLVL